MSKSISQITVLTIVDRCQDLEFHAEKVVWHVCLPLTRFLGREIWRDLLKLAITHLGVQGGHKKSVGATRMIKVVHGSSCIQSHEVEIGHNISKRAVGVQFIVHQTLLLTYIAYTWASRTEVVSETRYFVLGEVVDTVQNIGRMYAIVIWKLREIWIIRNVFQRYNINNTLFHKKIEDRSYSSYFFYFFLDFLPCRWLAKVEKGFRTYKGCHDNHFPMPWSIWGRLLQGS